MDEMTLGTSKYVSTKRAAKITGYAQDYVGQMVRSGKLKATKVGKSWFVLEDDALKLAGKPTALQGPDRALALLEKKRVTTTESIVSVSVEYPKTWSSVQYFSEDGPLLPISDSRDTISNQSSIELLDEHRVRISRSVTSPKSAGKATAAPRQETERVELRSVDGIRYATAVHAAPGAQNSASEDRLFDEHPAESADMAVVALPGKVEKQVWGVAWFLRLLISAVIVSLVAILIPIF